jgi:hypothetical protein
VADAATLGSALAPGVALTSVVIYWANLQSRLDAISSRVRGLNGELRGAIKASPRALSVARQVAMLSHRSLVLHVGVVLSVVALVGFLGASAALFISLKGPPLGQAVATVMFMVGQGAFGASLCTTLWEMLWARRSLEEDIRSSQPPGA